MLQRWEGEYVGDIVVAGVAAVQPPDVSRRNKGQRNGDRSAAAADSQGAADYAPETRIWNRGAGVRQMMHGEAQAQITFLFRGWLRLQAKRLAMAQAAKCLGR